ncbi:MAG TPA: flagellar hook-basal body complex protein FliE [Xanthomonadaceae bacterium]|jgi:flagellar hook-basal body complex protein FliE
MSAIDAIAAISGDVGRVEGIQPERMNRADFSQVIGEGLAQVDHSLKTADLEVREVAAGKDIPIHDVMIALERARMDLTMAVEIRNRLVDGYQELMRMQL